jgi:hypothetical protein
MGAEVGGPIIKDKLFIWVGYVPEINRSHMVQYVDRFSKIQTARLRPTPTARPSSTLLQPRDPGESTTHNYAGKLTWRDRPEQTLSLSLVGIRKDQEYMRGANMDLLAGMTHDLTNRQDIIAHWQSAFFRAQVAHRRHLGLHTEATRALALRRCRELQRRELDELAFAGAVQSAAGALLP